MMALDFQNSREYSVQSTLEITQTYYIVRNVFDPHNTCLADLYKPWRRCLAVIDFAIYDLYGRQIREYFDTFHIMPTIQRAHITEDRKDIEALEEVCSWITDYNILRREPLLVIGGGLVTDVVG